MDQGIPFRVLETFSSDEIVSSYITDLNVRRQYLENVYRYLVKRKYFKLVRQLLEEKVPPLYDVLLSPPNSISETLLQMIQHPLRLLIAADRNIQSHQTIGTGSLISDECVTLILSSFVNEILVPQYSPPIQLFIVPCLANSSEFPFFYLLQYLSEKIVENDNNATMHTNDSGVTIDYHSNHQNFHKTKKVDNIFDSSYFFKSFLILDQSYLEQMFTDTASVRNYVKILGRFSNNIRKLQQRTTQSIFRQMDVDVDDFDSDEEESYKEKIPSLERECLLEAITLLNDQKRAELILEHNDNYLDDVSVLYSLCKICHNLMLYHRVAVLEYRFVYSIYYLCFSVT